jgi:mono/diheme cytochrome c family protein
MTASVRRRIVVFGSAVMVVLVSVAAIVLLSTRGVEATGRGIYADYCASCHGADLEGQPNWQVALANGRMPAPPHDATGHTWHHSDDDLFTIVKFGMSALVPGIESDMPGFQGVLSDDEIRAVLAFIKSTWPPNERTYQALQSRRP